METAKPGTPEEFRTFERFMRKLVAVPKKEVDRKRVAFKRRKKKSPVRISPKGHRA